MARLLECVQTEVVVPFALVWWTFQALRGQNPSRFGAIRFVREPSGTAQNVVVDASVLPSMLQNIPSVNRVFVLLWNGQESCLEYQESIETLAGRVRGLELLMVGDLFPHAVPGHRYCACTHLFSQELESEELPRCSSDSSVEIKFSNPCIGIVTCLRGTLISTKVALQICWNRRWPEYRAAQYVFCGDSGYSTLRKYEAAFQMSDVPGAGPADGLNSGSAYIASWLTRLVGTERNWKWRVASRALLRLVALRVLHRLRPDGLFLNLVPRSNLNAYQAAFLFNHCTFLEFGGMHGDEAIYPRTADLAYFHRKVLRFDTSSALDILANLSADDRLELDRFIRSYEERTVARLDACTACASSEHESLVPWTAPPSDADV